MIDVIALIVAVIALILSLVQWVSGLYSQRFRISVSCIGYSISDSELIPNFRQNIFGFVVCNHSSLPISINRIDVQTVSGEFKSFNLTRRFLKEHYIPPGLDNPYQFFTTDFPINIDAYSSALVFATYETKDENMHVSFVQPSMCCFRFVTNRKTKRFFLECFESNFLEK